MVELARPALRYYGSKWLLAPWIIEHFPAHECYVEPFGGGASVLLRKPSSPIEVYNDLDGEAVNFFRVLRERMEELLTVLELTPYSREELDLALSGEPTSDPIERARRFYITSRQARGGGRQQWRTGWRYTKRHGDRFTVTGEWAALTHLEAVATRLKEVHLEHGPALEVIDRFDSDVALFYCDPPYLPDTRSERWRRKGYRHEMSDDDHRALAERLSSIEGMAIVSGYASPMYDEIYEGWECRLRSTQTSDSKVRATECLWLSPRAAAGGRQKALL